MSSLRCLLLVALPALACAQTTLLPEDVPDDDLVAYQVGSNDDALADRIVDDDRLVRLGVLQRVYGKLGVDAAQRQFLGIPYAKARRFEAPRKLTLWERLGTKNATVFGASCKSKPGSTNGPNPYTPFWAPTNPDTSTAQSEDCLNLNIWAPRAASIPRGTLLPVMVNIHGGGYDSGSSSDAMNNMAYIQRKAPTPIVVVNFNYRFGVLGFGAAAELAAEDAAPGKISRGAAFGGKGTTGLYGILDQVQALRWIKANIRAFGGNPNNITVFGESAGAMSINTLQTLPVVATEKLFQRAILQSGTIDSLRPTPLAKRDARFKTLAGKVGCGPALNLTTKCLVDCMRAVPVDTLLAAEVLFDWSPTIDNVLLRATPLGYNNGTLYRVPTIIGYTSQDGSVFTGPIFQKLLAGQVPTVQDYNLFVAGAATVFGAVGTPRYNYAVGNITQVLYPISRYGNNPVLAATDLVTDVAFRCVTLGYVSVNNAVTNGANPVYVYEFSYLLAAFRAAAAQTAALIGVFHSSDIPFANGLFPAPLLTPAEVQLESEMLGAWVRFAATGNPNANPASPTWLPSSSGTKTVFSTPSKNFDPIVLADKFAQCQGLSRL